MSVIGSCGHPLSDSQGVGKPIEYWVPFECDRSDMEHGGGPAFISGVFCEKCLNQGWLKKAIKLANEKRGNEHRKRLAEYRRPVTKI